MINLGYFSTSMVGDAWPKILSDRVIEVGMTDDEYYHFVRFFLLLLPYNFTGKSFMGVKIKRV